MALSYDLEIASKQNQVSPEEWQQRVDLAALYRLVAAHGWDDMIYTHISARVPGSEHHFLINPYGMYFEEITASCLVKIDMDGNILDDTSFRVNKAGFCIHSAVHMAREDAKCVMHLHSVDGVAVSAQKQGLLPLTQTAMLIHHDIAYHDYEGVALDLAERDTLAADLGDKNLMILRNHGTLTLGETCGDAWQRMFYLERACAMQLKAMAGGAELNFAAQGIPQKVTGQAKNVERSAKLSWRGALRWLDRRDPSYRN